MPKRLFIGLVALAASLGFASLAQAQTAVCDALESPKKEVAAELLDTLHSYGCCDGTLRTCLQSSPSCSVPQRLANEVCRRIGRGEEREAVEHAIDLRTRSMTSTAAPVPIDLSSTQIAGDATALVTAVVYACGRCRFCAGMEPRLYELVTTGALQGKVRLAVRPFPIRSHTGSTEAGLGMIAAERLGNLWGFLHELYKNYDSFDPAKLPDYADAAGIDATAFRAQLADPSTRSRLVASKKEGTRNKVDATPTMFINGRPWLGQMSLELVQDVLEEAVEKARTP